MALTDQNQSQHSLPPWPQLSFALARDMLEKESHRTFLTLAESEQLEVATRSYSDWLQFITVSKPEYRLTAFRVRTMLFEQLIPHLYPNNLPCCNNGRIDFDKIAAQARAIPPSVPNEHIPTSTMLICEPEGAACEDQKAEEEAPAIVSSTVSVVHDIDRVPLRDVYQTLESDHRAIAELRRSENAEAERDEKHDLQGYMLSIFNDDAPEFKYLLQGIAANREKTSLTDRELKGLLSEVRPHGKGGQEEFYVVCRKVLEDLKKYTPHCVPFLKKVTKREAPDYDDVIDKPMDLETMSQKLLRREYKTKKEYADDLYLIYSNCLQYNTGPASAEYRQYAITMRQRTKRLLSRVPDISVRDRGGASHDDEGDDGSERAETPLYDYPNGSRASRERSMTRESSTAPTADSVEELSLQSAPEHRTFIGKKGTRCQTGGHVGSSMEPVTTDDESDSEEELSGLQSHVWQKLTKETRAKLGFQSDTHEQGEFGDRPAILRSSLDMKRFFMLERMHYSPETQQKLIRCTHNSFARWVDRGGGQGSIYDDFDIDSGDDESTEGSYFYSRGTRPKSEEDDSTRADLFLPEYMLSCGVPEIAGIPEEHETAVFYPDGDDLDDPDEESDETAGEPGSCIDVSLEVYPSTLTPNHGLWNLVDHNTQTLNDIRLLYSKCNVIRNNAPISTGETETAPRSPEPFNDPADANTPVSARSRVKWSKDSPPPLVIHQAASEEVLQRTLVKLLAHAGFEGAHSSALNVLTDLCTDYILNIGKTLRAYWDDYNRQMSSEEILMHSLYENGVTSVMDLELYICDDVERYGSRLEDVKRRLRASYQDLLTGPGHGGPEPDDILDNEHTFITGSFGQDVGEDFFGFRELGLDKELDLSTLSIPAKLWFGQQREETKPTPTQSDAPPVKYPPPPPFVPISSERDIIGLLKTLFRQKLAVVSDSHLVEDEYLPRQRNRSRYPPSSSGKQAAGGRKKPSKESQRAGAGTGDARKAKRKRPLEEIQAERVEKQRQKQEAKAQKQAEKEEKRKQREELKEKERLAKLEAKDKKTKKIKKENTNSVDEGSENTATSGDEL